jgi:hypothetical protein
MQSAVYETFLLIFNAMLCLLRNAFLANSMNLLFGGGQSSSPLLILILMIIQPIFIQPFFCTLCTNPTCHAPSSSYHFSTLWLCLVMVEVSSNKKTPFTHLTELSSLSLKNLAHLIFKARMM